MHPQRVGSPLSNRPPIDEIPTFGWFTALCQRLDTKCKTTKVAVLAQELGTLAEHPLRTTCTLLLPGCRHRGLPAQAVLKAIGELCDTATSECPPADVAGWAAHLCTMCLPSSTRDVPVDIASVAGWLEALRGGSANDPNQEGCGHDPSLARAPTNDGVSAINRHNPCDVDLSLPDGHGGNAKSPTTLHTHIHDVFMAPDVNPKHVAVLKEAMGALGSEEQRGCFLRLVLNRLNLRIGYDLVLLALHDDGRAVLKRKRDFEPALAEVLALRRQQAAVQAHVSSAPTPKGMRHYEPKGYVSPDLLTNELLQFIDNDGVDWSHFHATNPSALHRADHEACSAQCDTECQHSNARGLEVLAKVIAGPDAAVSASPRFSEASAQALRFFTAALGNNPCCSAAGLNAATVCLCTGDYAGALSFALGHNLAKGPEECPTEVRWPTKNGQRRAHLQMTAGFCHELMGNERMASDFYAEALLEDASFAVHFFGAHAQDLPKGTLFFKDTRLETEAEGPRARDIVRRTLCRLLMVEGFAGHALNGPGLSKSEAHDFRRQKHTALEAFLSPPVVCTLNEYYRSLVDCALIPFKDRRCDRYYAYHDSVGRFMLGLCQPLMCRLIGTTVKPSYTYFIEYVPGSELTPHTDRTQCEFVVSIQLSLSPCGNQWPIYVCAQPRMPYRGDQPLPAPELWRKVALKEGGAVVFKGREKVHWREPLPEGWQSAHLLLHYVWMDYAGPLKISGKD